MKELFMEPDASSRVAVYCRVGTETQREESLRWAEVRRKTVESHDCSGISIKWPDERRGGGAK